MLPLWLEGNDEGTVEQFFLGQPVILASACDIVDLPKRLRLYKSKIFYYYFDLERIVSHDLWGVLIVSNTGDVLWLEYFWNRDTWQDVHRGKLGPRWKQQLEEALATGAPVLYGAIFEAKPELVWRIPETWAEYEKSCKEWFETYVPPPEDRSNQTWYRNCFNLTIEIRMTEDDREAALRFLEDVQVVADPTVADHWGT